MVGDAEVIQASLQRPDLAVQKRASGKFPNGSGSPNRCSYWNKPDPFSVVATMNGPNLDYAGSWARNSPNLAVALNCGTGSSFLKALVNAFDKLHIVLCENSGYSGSKYSR
jgi:hypothetical protein